MNYIKPMLCLILAVFVCSAQSYAAKDKPQKRQLPTTYPYSYPYDEHHCPTGNCSRKNENPKQNQSNNKQQRDSDDD